MIITVHFIMSKPAPCGGSLPALGAEAATAASCSGEGKGEGALPAGWVGDLAALVALVSSASSAAARAGEREGGVTGGDCGEGEAWAREGGGGGGAASGEGMRGPTAAVSRGGGLAGWCRSLRAMSTALCWLPSKSSSRDCFFLAMGLLPLNAPAEFGPPAEKLTSRTAPRERAGRGETCATREAGGSVIF